MSEDPVPDQAEDPAQEDTRGDHCRGPGSPAALAVRDGCGGGGVSALRGVLEQSLEEGVLILQGLYTAHEIVDLRLQQLDLLGQLGQRGWACWTLEPARQRPADGRVHHDPHDGDEAAPR